MSKSDTPQGNKESEDSLLPCLNAPSEDDGSSISTGGGYPNSNHTSIIPPSGEEISLCPECFCMTHTTVTGLCTKCRKLKVKYE